MTLTAWIVICWTSVALAGPPSKEGGADWIYLEQEGVDVFLGAFHDKISGAFVNLEVGIPGLLDPAAPNLAVTKHIALVKGESAGWQYTMVSVSEDRAELIQSICPAQATQKVAQSLVISFVGDHPYFRHWNFTALICSPFQLERVNDFLLNRSTWRAAPSTGGYPSIVGTEDIQRISPGMSWEEVRSIFGAGIAPQSYQGGFWVSYYVAEGKQPKYNQRIWLLFDQARTLKKVTNTMPQIPF